MSTSKNREKMKRLQTMRSKTQAELDALKIQQQQIREEVLLKTNTIKSLNSQIKNLSKKSKEPTISEHAILRYMERVVGINLDKIEEKILPENTRQMIKSLGDGKYPVEGENFKIVVKDNLVVTIIVDEQ